MRLLIELLFIELFFVDNTAILDIVWIIYYLNQWPLIDQSSYETETSLRKMLNLVFMGFLG